MKKVFLLSAGLLFLIPVKNSMSAQDTAVHPFLLVKESQIDSLIALTGRSPWKESFQHALEDFENLTYDPYLENFGDKATSLRDMISATTLCFLLDTSKSQRYLDSLDSYLGYLDNIYETRNQPPDDWDSNVPVASVAFNAILSLDITYPFMTADRREAHEQRISRLVDENHGWYLSEYALRGLWAIYQGDSVQSDHFINLYNQRLESLVTPDGIFNGGTGYSTSRFVKDQREHKFCFMDVIEFQGMGSYYNNPRYQALYEWIFCHNFTTYGSILTFGDAKRGTSARRKLYESPATYRAGRFSDNAAGWAAWHVQDTLPQGRLLIYLLMQEPADPVRPDGSHIYPDGGAFFLSNPGHEEILSATLWNCRSESGHSHKEVNALGLAAYGEDLIVNSGYNNWGNGKFGFSWNYIHDQAISGNTALINGLDHRSKSGNGIRWGFIDPSLSFAQGDAGEALTGGSHLRGLLFVPGDPVRNGYVVVLDEIGAEIPYSFVNLPFHPASETVEIAEENRQYRWAIRRWASSPVSLDIRLVTPPRSVTIRDGLLADKSHSIIGKYIHPDFLTNEVGKANIATVLFPHDGLHSLPEMSDCSNGSLHATRIHHSPALTDLVLSSASDSMVKGEQLRFRGASAFLRMEGDTIRSLFAANADHLKNCGGQFTGFRSDRPVTLYLNNAEGYLYLEESASIDFFFPGIEKVLLDEVVATPLLQAENHQKIRVGAGRYSLKLEYVIPDSITDPLPCGIDSAATGGLLPVVSPVAENALWVYPNPASDRAYISLMEYFSGEAKLEVIDLTGRIVYSETRRLENGRQRPDFTLDCSLLQPGIYLIKVSDGTAKNLSPAVRILSVH